MDFGDEYNLILQKGDFNIENKLYLGSRPGIIKNFEDGNPLNIETFVSALPINQANDVNYLINLTKPLTPVTLIILLILDYSRNCSSFRFKSVSNQTHAYSRS